MGKDTCNKCIHCTHVAEDFYYFCEIDNEYISGNFALDEELECDGFVEKLDDNETQKTSA